MGITHVPGYWLWVCDGCDAEVKTDTNNKPKHWTLLTLGRTAYDYQGAAVADGSVSRFFCDKCSPKLEAAINGAFDDFDRV